jgi:hypothetical protein
MYLAYYREAAEILYDSELTDIAQVLSTVAEFYSKLIACYESPLVENLNSTYEVDFH